MTATSKTNDLHRLLFEKYGALMSGAALYRTLGYPSSAAFTRAKASGAVEVHVFKLDGRRGTFALTTDVAAWLASHRAEARTPLEGRKDLRKKSEDHETGHV